jgi:hypothetical protein
MLGKDSSITLEIAELAFRLKAHAQYGARPEPNAQYLPA